MSHSSIDIFPVELIYQLLNYFSAHEIFHTFTNISSYIDNVLLDYSNYRLNFKSITKKEFDLVCQRITPSHVISLTLCDNENTPGQIELFLSRFQLNQFTRLCSLTLIDIGPDYWESIVTNLNDLKNLRSFFCYSMSKTDTWISKISYDNIIQLDLHLFNNYSLIFPHLKWLRFTHGYFLNSIQFPYLLHLILRSCTIDTMTNICHAAPNLKSLTTVLKLNESDSNFILPFNQMNRLTLHTEGANLSMSNIEQIIANLPCLKYLQLRTHGYGDLLDGQRLQLVTKHLITFNIMFSIIDDSDLQDLDSFRSSYWLNEKHWYVAYAYNCLFSVPFYATTFTNEQFDVPILSTLPDNTIFNTCITHLTLSEPSINTNHYFNQVHTLTMYHFIPLSSIVQIVDLNRIQHLCLCITTEYHGIISVINEMPSLYRITLRNKVKEFLDIVQANSLKKIRHLEIGVILPYDDDDNYNIEQLNSVFPNVQNLDIAYLCSIVQIFNFINQFKKLLTASFYCIPWSAKKGYPNEDVRKLQLTLDENRSSHKFDYTYRFDQSTVYMWF
ncbi:unnamed protein product [Adineta steineri]|uniref:F-box domain-containing protein n=1 Tax=Adineta steineri TaxID=433720 RepID=A0A814C6W4_9BILA|nr:unnamed protein product [Adineta steineri]CAF0938996.1 unnamed protein product [Adineta steineri]CAF1003935.1 unnamed protein product [Adineta steineri]CAF3596502.1 unnamed protein product [Adineta steineri]CAF3684945.1 unnamed protein product [Adineta steineri]